MFITPLDNIHGCESYNLTSQAEEDEEEEEVVVGSKRKRAKRNFDNYVVGVFLIKYRNVKHGNVFFFYYYYYNFELF